MKRFIKWSCKPAPFGYHLVATTDVDGWPLDVNVAISQKDWDSVVNKHEILEGVTFQVNRAFDVIATRHAIAQRHTGVTLH